MFKKITLAMLISILAAVTTITLTSAETQGEPAPADASPTHRALIGEVLEIGPDFFTVESLTGDLITISVTDDTVFRRREAGQGYNASFSDLGRKMWVAVHQTRDRSGNAARLVVILPEDFDPSQLKAIRLLGEVEKINPGQKTFEVITRKGDPVSLQVNEQTRYIGDLNTFDDLEKGQMVAVLAVEQEDGTYLAKLVGAGEKDRPRLQKTGGKIIQIGESGFTIQTRQGEEKSYTVTEATRFGSRQGEIDGLEDLALDMVVIVVSQPGQDQAAAVLVADKALLQLERVRGTVQSAGGSHLTITAGDEKMQFTVDENTRIQGREIEDLNDLKNGMSVLVLYVEKNGSLLAKGIIAANPDRN